MITKLPIVAIVGRANVGKSSLFNAMLDRREAIVAREPGTTRDSTMAKVSLTAGTNTAGKLNNDESLQFDFWLVDTAGMKDPDDEFEASIQEQITQAADSADVILVVVEANVMITEEDRRVATMALKSGKPVLLIVNKVDRARGNDYVRHFQGLGIKEIFGTSAVHKEGLAALANRLMQIMPKVTLQADDDTLRIALLGRPNVGKSSLFNTLAKKQQAIVADRAGTTRDINRASVRVRGRTIELMDTAGIRRPGRIEQGVEHFSVLRSLAAIEQADVCILIMDANELHVQLDQKIAGMVQDAGKGLILAVTKWDTYSDKTAFSRDELTAELANTFDFVPWAPLLLTSAVTGQNATKLFDLVLEIDTERHKRLKTSDLNQWLRKRVDAHPPSGIKNHNPKLNYIVQESDNPTPAFKIFGSQTKFLHWSYRRYLERGLRETFGFAGTPVQLWFIEKHLAHKHGESPTKTRDS